MRTETALKTWVTLARAFNAVAAHSNADIASHGLTPGEFAILEALHHKGAMLHGELRQKVLVTSGGITFLVDKLIARGLVRRRVCAEDRRARYAELTPKGAALIAGIFPGHAAAVARAVSGLTVGEQRQAAALLKKLGLSAAALSAK